MLCPYRSEVINKKKVKFLYVNHIFKSTPIFSTGRIVLVKKWVIFLPFAKILNINFLLCYCQSIQMKQQRKTSDKSELEKLNFVKITIKYITHRTRFGFKI